MTEDDFDRRTVLKGSMAGVVAAAGLAGCTGGAESDSGNDSGGSGGGSSGSGGGSSGSGDGGDNGSANRNSAGDRTMRVVLEEWQVKPDATSIPAGTVTFNAVNEGHETHELVVRQRNDDGAYEELDEVDDVAKGETKQLRMDLAPGTYELCCLIVEEEDGETEDHYKLGMHTEVEVRQA